MPSSLPRWIQPVLIGFFPVHAAFPEFQAGRHPQLHFRGLLKVHSRYGLQDRSPAYRGLCHGAPLRPLPVPNGPSATMSYRYLHWRNPPPLVTRAFGAHGEIRVSWPGPRRYQSVVKVGSPCRKQLMLKMCPRKTGYGAGNTEAKDPAGDIVDRPTGVAGLGRSPLRHSAQ
jgi:hypothetical protein